MPRLCFLCMRVVPAPVQHAGPILPIALDLKAGRCVCSTPRPEVSGLNFCYRVALHQLVCPGQVKKCEPFGT